MTKQKQFPVRFEVRMSDDDYSKLALLAQTRGEGKATIIRDLIRQAHGQLQRASLPQIIKS